MRKYQDQEFAAVDRPPTPREQAVPRPSATLVLMREGRQGPEVLLVRRADRGDQNSNAWVFPGGLLDPSDAQVRAFCRGLDDVAASAQLGLGEGGLDYLIAALRETLEEAGLLLAVDAQGRPLGAESAGSFSAWRRSALGLPRGQGGAALAELCRERGWRLAVDELLQIGHWITPLGLPKRFDTRFFLASAPAGQEVEVDGVEIVEHRWVRPERMLRPDAEIQVRGPARAVLQDLARHASLAAVRAWAAALGTIRPVRPRLGRDGQDRVGPIHPSHPAYAEIGRLDPQGRGTAASALRPGVPVELAPGLIRVTAPNGSVMTGPGTNSYLLRCDARGAPGGTWAVIDPGPDDERHVQALMAALPGRLAAILVTHTHIDHSPAARRLKDLTGAVIHGRLVDDPAHRGHGQDPLFLPDATPRDGERLRLGPELELLVIHTPGHASNHLCFLHGRERILFTGDHVMQGSTVVINPPDGDMSAYLDSLARLAGQVRRAEDGFDWIAPGHGFLMAEPARVLETLVRHRQRREAKVMAALSSLEAPASIDQLLAPVYEDVPADRHPIARRSLLAHLLRLQELGRALHADGLWHAA